MPSHAKRMASHKIRDAEFNSTLSVGEIHKYALYPVKSGKVVIDSVRDKLARYIKSGTYRPIPSRHRPEYDGVLVWKVTTNEKEAEALQRSLGSDAELRSDMSKAEFEGDNFNDSSLSSHPLHNIRYQRNAPDDLRVVSWPHGTPSAPPYYAYDDEFVENPIIYVIDRGFDSSSVDFRPGVVKDWLYSPEIIDQGNDTQTDDNYGPSHGTCVASKAIGTISGVFKGSSMIILKLAWPLLDSDIQWAFDEVYDNILTQQRLDLQPVVVIAAFGSTENPSVRPWPDIKRSMTSTFSLGAAIVVPSGNHARDRGRSPYVDQVPAIWADADANFPLIVAGAVDNAGNAWRFSQGGNHVTVWAPGNQVQCADRGRTNFRFGDGTSFATGMVGGLVAYAFAQGEVVSGLDAKQWLVRFAWRRVEARSPPVVWNAVRTQGKPVLILGNSSEPSLNATLSASQ